MSALGRPSYWHFNETGRTSHSEPIFRTVKHVLQIYGGAARGVHLGLQCSLCAVYYCTGKWPVYHMSYASANQINQ